MFTIFKYNFMYALIICTCKKFEQKFYHKRRKTATENFSWATVNYYFAFSKNGIQLLASKEKTGKTRQ